MENFALRLIAWFQVNKRDLPWRHTQDPYFIWLSEVILQQTRVNQGMPYYLKFTTTYPSVQDLANAEEKDILRLWQGLGYYSRARNMHHAAKVIVTEYEGKFPDTYKKLKKLKGIGDYTAAAVASFAFGEKVAVVDGNVFRVLSRVFGVEEDISSTKGKKTFTALANSLLPDTDSSTYNQAIMEFGALYCKPTSPNCPECIFKDSCVAFAQNKQDVLPVKNKKIVVKKRYFYYLVIEDEGKLLMKERGEGDIWQGLYDFILLEKDATQKPVKETDTTVPQNITSQLFQQVLEQTFAGLFSEVTLPLSNDRSIILQKESSTYIHQLTHQTIYVQFWHLRADKVIAESIRQETGYTYYTFEQIHQVPKPILIDNFLKEYFPTLFAKKEI
jgi:A/G-specific adenine glycosylase